MFSWIGAIAKGVSAGVKTVSKGATAKIGKAATYAKTNKLTVASGVGIVGLTAYGAAASAKGGGGGSLDAASEGGARENKPGTALQAQFTQFAPLLSFVILCCCMCCCLLFILLMSSSSSSLSNNYASR